jgi:energy-coupling factor transporter ATP-binding protein EcfA2
MPAFPNPFPGLRPFEAADRDRFFGRDLQVQELGKRLAENRVITIIGGSGCGKSSLVRAGLLPALTGLGIASAGRIWQPVVFIPGRFADRAERRSPLYSLARAFDSVLIDDPDRDARVERILNNFDTVGGFGRLVDAFSGQRKVRTGQEALRDKANYLFVIDQFEELFSEELRTEPEPISLISRIVENWRNPHPRAYIVLTMRSEHLENCTAYGDFPEVINATSYLVRRLRDSELRDSIVRPIEQLCMELAAAGAGETEP